MVLPLEGHRYGLHNHLDRPFHHHRFGIRFRLRSIVVLRIIHVIIYKY